VYNRSHESAPDKACGTAQLHPATCPTHHESAETLGRDGSHLRTRQGRCHRVVATVLVGEGVVGAACVDGTGPGGYR